MSEDNWTWTGDNDEEENEDFEFQNRWGTKDSIIFLIDCTKSMFVKSNKESSFDVTIKCVQNVMTRKIISSENDLIGVVFFGTNKSSNDEFKHIFKFQELMQLGAEPILEIEKLLEGNNNGDFSQKYGHSNNFSLSDALWVCSTMFSTCTLRIGYKRIMLFTNNDDPHITITDLRNRAKLKAQDLSQVGIEIELFPIKGPNEKFDVGKFYQDIVYNSEDYDKSNIDNATDKFEELLTRVWAKDHKKRVQGNIMFLLSEELKLSVGVYTLVRSAYKPYFQKMFKNTNEAVKTNTKLYLHENAEILLPSDIKKYMTFGGSPIYFEKNEIDEMKKFDTSGLLLMGFKPMSYLKPYYHVSPAQFLYPDESFLQGSTSLFAALLEGCLKHKVIMICRFIPRKNAFPKFVALLPQEEKIDDQNLQKTAAGFNIITLPYSDDLRKLCLPEIPKANEEQINKAKEFIKKLQFPFSSENFENPVLQKHYRNIEALALDRHNIEEIVDHTEPQSGLIEKRAGKIIKEFQQLVYPDDYEPGKMSKKKAPSASASASRKAKVENSLSLDIRKEAQDGNLNKLTVPVLKEFVTKTGIKSSSNKKADLISAIHKHFNID